jgi:hypothetical protein
MQKLKLKIEALAVDSYSVSGDGPAWSGTVRGAESYDTYWCTAPSSVGPNICRPTGALGCVGE